MIPASRAVCLIGLAAAVAAAPGAHAQHDGFFLTSPFSLGATHESRFIVDGRELSDNVLVLMAPTLSLVDLSPRGELSIGYQPELQAFQEHRDLTAVNHHAELVFTRALSPAVDLAIGDVFISTADPSRGVVDSVLLLPRDRFTENTFFVDLSRRLGPFTALSVRVDNTWTRVSSPSTSRTGLSDRLTTAGGLTLSRRVGRRHTLGGTYRLVDSRPLGNGDALALAEGATLVPAESDQAHSASLSYAYEGDRHSFRVIGGLLAGRGTTYTGSAQIDKALGRRSTFSLIAQRNLSLFGGVGPTADLAAGSGLMPFALHEAVVARLKLDLSRALSMQVQAAVQRTLTDLTDVDVRSDLGRVRFDYRVTRGLAFYGLAEMYKQSLNEIVGAPVDWRRFGAGLEVSLSSKPNPLEERRRAQAERERRVRRGEAAEEDPAGAGTGGLSSEPRPSAGRDSR